MMTCASISIHVGGRIPASIPRTRLPSRGELARSLVRPSHASQRVVFTRGSLADPPASLADADDEKEPCCASPVLQELGIPEVEVSKVLEIAAAPLNWEAEAKTRKPVATIMQAEWVDCYSSSKPKEEPSAKPVAQVWDEDCDKWKANLTELYKYLLNLNLTRRSVASRFLSLLHSTYIPLSFYLCYVCL